MIEESDRVWVRASIVHADKPHGVEGLHSSTDVHCLEMFIWLRVVRQNQVERIVAKNTETRFADDFASGNVTDGVGEKIEDGPGHQGTVAVDAIDKEIYTVKFRIFFDIILRK